MSSEAVESATAAADTALVVSEDPVEADATITATPLIESHEEIEEIQNQDDKSDQTAAFYEQELARLRSIISIQNADNMQLELKLTESEQLAKQKCEELNQNFTLKLEQTLKKFQEGHKDKTSSLVMKYAEGEKKCIDLNRNIEFLKSKLDDSTKEKQRVNDRLDKAKQETTKLNGEYEKKIHEIMLLKKETEKLKELAIVAEAREKASLLKLKLESEAHLACKRSLEQTVEELNSLKLSNEKIPDEEITNEEKIETNELVVTSSTEISAKTSPSLKATHKDINVKELEALKSQLKDMFEERTILRDSLQATDKERKLQDVSLAKYKETLQSQKQMNKDLLNEILQLRELQETLVKDNQDKIGLEQKVKMLTSELNDLQLEMSSYQEKQNELLSFTAKLTEKNTHLQSENSLINEKLAQVDLELTQTKNTLEASNNDLSINLQALKANMVEELAKNKNLCQELEEKKKEIEELSIKLSDEQDENTTLKKKHQANIKDLSRQLQKMSNAASQQTPPNHGHHHSGSPSSAATSNNSKTNFIKTSRTNSITSLSDKEIVGIENFNSMNAANLSDDNRSLNNETGQYSKLGANHYNEVICGTEEVYVVDIDKQKVIEKVVKLQKLLAKRNEKIDFMQDHVNQLTADLKRKTKIIQAYAMNESGGAFTSEAHDAIKREMSRKTGHMSTLYNTNRTYLQTAQFINSNESNMTMELCLEINGKLQALLEDTLIKNLTLKESIETLGQEIARLSKENRQIKLNS